MGKFFKSRTEDLVTDDEIELAGTPRQVIAPHEIPESLLDISKFPVIDDLSTWIKKTQNHTYVWSYAPLVFQSDPFLTRDPPKNKPSYVPKFRISYCQPRVLPTDNPENDVPRDFQRPQTNRNFKSNTKTCHEPARFPHAALPPDQNS